MKIILVAGARPNFMKVAPILAELKLAPDEFQPFLVHTGQHYDYSMSEIFFRDLALPEPDRFLDAHSGSPVAQTAHILSKFESVLDAETPDLVLVVGDVTSTPACALAASKRDLPIGHVEAGLRSGDRRMPEELNRIVTDGLSDLLFTHSREADDNLKAENVPVEHIFRIGNIMIDTLLHFRPRAASSDILDQLGLCEGEYALATLHRPSNVDDADTFRGILAAFEEVQSQIPVVFQIHPRTKERISNFGLEPVLERMSQLQTIEPQGYVDMIRLQEQAAIVLTDSGGMQEETTVLGVPCLTLRSNTERPVTVTEGTNRLVGSDPDRIIAEAKSVLGSAEATDGRVPDLWDGRSARRLAETLRQGIVRR